MLPFEMCNIFVIKNTNSSNSTQTLLLPLRDLKFISKSDTHKFSSKGTYAF